MKKLSKHTVLCLAAVGIALASFTSATHGQGQLFGQSKPDIDTELIPGSAVGSVILFPQPLLKNPNFNWIPREIISAQGKVELGFDAMLIEQMTMLFPAPELPPQNPLPEFAVVLRFSEFQGLAGNLIDRLEEKTIAGKKAFVGDERRGEPSFVIFDESTILMGSTGYLEQVIRASGGDLAKLMQNSPVSGQAMAFFNIAATRDFAAQLIGQMPRSAPPLEQLKDLPELIDSVEIGMDVANRMQTDVILTAVSDSAAQDVKEIVSQALTFAHVLLLDELNRELDANDPVQAATIQYVNRIWDKYESKLIPTVKGRTLKIQLHEEVMALPLLAGFLGRPLSRAMDVDSGVKNNLRQTALAILNYESAYRRFPPPTLNDEQGRPLFSGLVSVLPFIEQSAFYESLKLDEPWDSRHNQEVLETMIPVFATEQGGARIPVFPGSVWDSEEGRTFGDIKDGSSNTILAINPPPGVSSSWADPRPWKLSATDPKRDVFGDRDEVWVVMVDGSVRKLIRSETSNETLKALLTVDGGEVIR